MIFNLYRIGMIHLAMHACVMKKKNEKYKFNVSKKKLKSILIFVSPPTRFSSKKNCHPILSYAGFNAEKI
jgi:hypothetical protein